jgi:hypothetical protein
MKITEILSYLGGFIVGSILTIQLIHDYNPNNILWWLFTIPIFGFDILLTLHLIQRIRAEYGDE